MNQKSPIVLRAAAGFGLGGIALSIYVISYISIPSLRDGYYWLILLIFALGISGAVGGLALGYKRKTRHSLLLNGFGFGVGFIIGGFIVCLSLLGLAMAVEEGDHYDSKLFLDFYWIFILGFTVAGVLGAAITRSRVLSVINGAFSFCIGGAVGGAVIGVIFKITWRPSIKETLPGILAAYIAGGAIAGFLTKAIENSESK